MKNVSLVLGSGGARGLAHIGVIEELESRDYTIKAIAGCSIGAVIGGVYAAGHLDDFKKWITNLDKYGVFNLMDFTLTSQGFIKGDRVFKEMKKFVETTKIEELKIPFKAVSVDVHNQKEVVFDQGDLFEAIRASVAIPSVLTPVYKDDAVLVDGGVMNPLPIGLLEKDEKSICLAVDLNSLEEYKPKEIISDRRKKELKKEENKWVKAINDLFNDFGWTGDKEAKDKKKRNYYELINSSFTLMQTKLTEITVKEHKPDILISIPKKSASTFDFFKGEELIAYGREKAKIALDEFEQKQG